MPHGVAHPGERQVGDQEEIGRALQDLLGAGVGAARHVDDDVVELVAQLGHQQLDRAVVEQQRLVGALLGAEHEQALGVLDQHPVHEQAVDPVRVLERLAQAVAGLEVERQRDGAELQVEVDQRDPPPPLMGDQPGDAGGHGGRADAAPGAGDRDQLAELVVALDHAALLGRGEDRLLQQAGVIGLTR